jgi:RNA polymerase sigma-70 factor, ECF subfamily
MKDVGLNFQEIYSAFHGRVERYLTRMMGAAESEDLTQEVFLKISRALPAYRGESKLTTWIFRIATNTALDALRSRAHKLDQLTEGLECAFPGEDSESCRVGESAPGSSLEQQVMAAQRSDCYQRYIEKLPEKYRVVVALSELEGFVAGEIADVLGLSVETVKMRLHRGRSRLLLELKTHCLPEDWL